MHAHDSFPGHFPEDTTAGPGAIRVHNRMTKVRLERDPGALSRDDLGADLVIESTGIFDIGSSL